MKTLLALFGCACALLSSAPAQSDSIDWSTVDGGGRSSTGGVYTITGTIGQPDAGRWKMTGGAYTVNGGFWGRIAVVQMPGAPLLTIRETGVNTLAICWPYPSTGYGLERSIGLEVLNWVATTNVPVHVSEEWQITLTPPPAGGSLEASYGEYYRLKQSGP